MKQYVQVEEFLAPLAGEVAGLPRWPQAALLLSRSLEKRGEHFAAAEWLSRLLSRTPAKRIKEDAEDILKDIVRKSLTVEELNYLAYRFQENPLLCLVIEKAAAEESRGKRWEELWNLLGLAESRCGEEGRKTWERHAPAALHNVPPGRCKDPYLVGLVCPFEGPFAEYGESLRRGASIGLEEHNGAARFKLALAVRDTRADPVFAVAAARELVVDEGVVCVIGGLLSSTTTAIAGVTSALEVPLVSPSATREEIALAGPLVFQSALPRVMQARALSQAARSKLNAAKAAVLYPESPDGKLLSASFEEAFERSGGTVVISSGYLEGESNFGGLLSEVSSKKPECLLLAGAGTDLVSLIPQLAYYDVDVPVLAVESISSGGIAELARRHLQLVLYTPDSYSLQGETRTRFEAAFKAQYGCEPDEFAVKGYLAFRLVAEAMEGGARSRGGVAKGLARLVSDEAALQAGRFLSMAALPGVEVPVLELAPVE